MLRTIFDKFLHFLVYIIPFTLLTTQYIPENDYNKVKTRLDFRRILETLIITLIAAFVAGLFTSYMTIDRLNIQMKYFQERINKFEKRMDKIDDILWQMKITQDGRDARK